MTDKFEIGEVAIVIDAHDHPVHIGCEALVCSSRFWHRFDDGDQGYWYECEIRGEKFSVDENHLRKKKPPSREIDQVTTWDKCAWQPRQLEHA